MVSGGKGGHISLSPPRSQPNSHVSPGGSQLRRAKQEKPESRYINHVSFQWQVVSRQSLLQIQFEISRRNRRKITTALWSYPREMAWTHPNFKVPSTQQAAKTPFCGGNCPYREGVAKPSAALNWRFPALFSWSSYEIALTTETDCSARKQCVPDTSEFKPACIEAASLLGNLCASGFGFIDLDRVQVL